MENNQTALYNEPIIQRKGDIVPQFSKVPVKNLTDLVKARLEIENNAMLCPVGNQSTSIQWTNAHKQVVTIMMGESDSPLSSRLRANAAGLAGQLGIAGITPALNRICLDESEDLTTRMNGICSLIKLAETDPAIDVLAIFKSGKPAIRLTAYRATIYSGNKRLSDLGKSVLAKESDKSIIDLINKKYKPGNSKELIKKRRRNGIW